MARIVEVTWLDSRQPNPEWQWIEGIAATVVECSTVGYLLSRDKKRLVIAQSLGDQKKQAGGVMTIPAACVTCLKFLRGAAR